MNQSSLKENLPLSPVESFFDTQKKLDNVDGWFYYEAHALFDCLLLFQQQENIKGNLFEIGVWDGKSACVLAKHTRPEEKLFLFDPLLTKKMQKVHDSFDSVLGTIPDNIESFAIPSEKYDTLQETLKNDLCRNVRYMHIDGRHSATGVDNDLEVAHKILATKGIVVIDDFFSITYPHITESVYHYLYRNPYHFKMFLCGYSKAYLCRPDFYTHYYEYCLKSLNKDMFARKIPAYIMKTSPIADSPTISVRSFSKELGDNKSGYQGADWDKKSIDLITRQKIDI